MIICKKIRIKEMQFINKIIKNCFSCFSIMLLIISLNDANANDLTTELDRITTGASVSTIKDFRKSIKLHTENLDHPSILRNVLLDLNSKYKNIKVRESNGLFLGGEGAANRVDGLTYYNRVVLNKTKMKQTKDLDHRDVFYLHEGLKAIGYEDKNYSLTLSIILSSSYKYKLSENDIAKIAIELNADTSNFEFSSSSGTSVGGGGDHTSLALKLDYLIGRLKDRIEIQEILEIINISIEPNTDSNLAYNVITITRDSEEVILIPNSVYNLLPDQRERIEKELSQTIEEILQNLR